MKDLAFLLHVYISSDTLWWVFLDTKYAATLRVPRCGETRMDLSKIVRCVKLDFSRE